MAPARLKLVPEELNFETVDSSEVPRDRKSKHNALMTRIIHDLKRIGPGVALKIPVSALKSQKIQNIRAALTRELSKTDLHVRTAIDENYFYVWQQKKQRISGQSETGKR